MFIHYYKTRQNKKSPFRGRFCMELKYGGINMIRKIKGERFLILQ